MITIGDILSVIETELEPGDNEYLVIFYLNEKFSVTAEDGKKIPARSYDILGPVTAGLESRVVDKLEQLGKLYNIQRAKGGVPRKDAPLWIHPTYEDWMDSKK